MSGERYETVVIGGGPAGSAAAYTLAAAGRQVCLVDRAVFPRDKLCGGGLTFRAERAFVQVFKQRWRTALLNASHNVEFHAQDGLVASIRTTTKIDFMMRRQFDHYLLELAGQAGAVLKLGDAVHTLDVARKTITLASGQEVTFDFLIGADGVNSMVAKTLFGRSFDPARIAFALEAEVPREKLSEQGDRVEFDFGAARWGYGWVFPKRDTVTIGVGGWHRLNPDLRRRFDRYVEARGLSAGDLNVKGQFLPAGDVRRAPGHGNVLLCGDAAGAVDPISGEGIPYAIWTGAAAGRAIDTALSQQRNALDVYGEAFAKIVAPFERAKFWRWFVYARPVQWLFVQAFRIKAVRDWILTER